MPRVIALVAGLVLAAAGGGCAKDNPSGGTGGKTGGSGTGGRTGAGGTTVAGSGGAPAGSGGATPVGSGGMGTGGAVAGTGGDSAGAGGGDGSGGTTADAGMSGDGKICQEAMYKFAPQIPTVYVLVDRSGTLFDGSTAVFPTLRTAVLEVVMDLQDEVRFGLGVFTGQANTMCPIFTTVPAALNNYTPLAAAYNAINRPEFKAETPAFQVLPLVKASLLADTSPGNKYVLFVTDTETDFCNDGNTLCPFDTVTYLIQDLYTAGIGTFILGLPYSGSQLSMGALRSWANAGTGQPTAIAAPGAGNPPTALDIYNQCQGETGWKSTWTTAGRTGMVPTATYMTTGGNAMVYTPDPTNRTALTTAIRAVIAGVKSCTFDLGNVGGRSIKVDTKQLDKAHVLIEKTEVPLDMTNGWRMNSATELELAGTACTAWRMPNSMNIDFQFPCEAIIFE